MSMTSLDAPPPDGLILGQQTPRLSHVPEHVTTLGHEAVEVAAVAGLQLDPWEELFLLQSLGLRVDGKWAAFEVGLDVARQNGKGTCLEARELAGIFAFGERLIIHSAHEQITASEHFRRILALIEGVPEFDRRILKVVRGKGSEAIELRGGQRIFFKTRTHGGGRGLTGDLVVLDEAMIIPVATTSALVPTMAARSVSGNPQLIYAGSAVDKDKHEHGLVFSRLRARGASGDARVAWFEWSADPGEGNGPDDIDDSLLNDPHAWAQANPGMGIRISQEHIANELGALGRREFAIERLGIGDWFDPDDNGARIPREVWLGCFDPKSVVLDPVTFAYDVTPDRSRSAIAAAGKRSDGLAHIEVVDHRRGTEWVAARALELLRRHGTNDIRCDATGPAGSLIPEFRALGINVIEISAKEHAQACGLIFDAITSGVLRHLNTPELDSAVRGAVTRSLGEAWAWSRKNSAVDISPLVACTIAHWGGAVKTTSIYESEEATI